MRISTGQINRDTILQIQDSASRIAKYSNQITTGKKAESFEEIAGDLTQILNMQDVKLNIGAYTKNIDTANGRLKATEQSLNTIQDIIIQARSLALSAGSSNPANVLASLAPTVRGYLENFDATLNTDFEGRYIFGGQNATTAPVNGVQAPAIMPITGAPTDYYQGDTERLKTITSANVTFEYGITADDPAFAQIRAGLQALWYGLENNDQTEITNATAQLQQAQANLSGLFGEVGGATAGLELIQNRHDGNLDFLEEQITTLEGADVTEAISKFTQEQSAFQASLLVMSKLNSVSLADYI